MSGKRVGRHRKQIDTKHVGEKRVEKHVSGRRRSAVAAAGALMIVPVVAAGEPSNVVGEDPTNVALATSAGGGLVGLTDPEDVSADGSLPEKLQIGSEALTAASDPGVLAFAGHVPVGPLGIPGTMLDAYMRAAQTVNTATPGCHMEWSLLASVGRIESNHARGGRVDPNGRTNPLILGPVLNGGGFAAITDTDGGAYDGDARWDRAVGPMQFIPSTWKGYASDGNGDGQTDPNNIFDATIGSAKYLCSGGMDMAFPQQRYTAVFRYNHSDSYVRTVLFWADAYAKGVTPVATTPVSEIPQLAPVAPPVSSPKPGVTQPVAPGATSTVVPSQPSHSTPPSGTPSSTPPSTDSPVPSTPAPTCLPTATPTTSPTAPATVETTVPCTPTSTTAPSATATSTTPSSTATSTTTSSSSSAAPAPTSSSVTSEPTATSTTGPVGSAIPSP